MIHISVGNPISGEPLMLWRIHPAILLKIIDLCKIRYSRDYAVLIAAGFLLHVTTLGACSTHSQF